MFSGIVEEAGLVKRFAKQTQAWRLEVEAALAAEDLAEGDSVAVNGCCLTAVEVGSGWLSFDLLEETVRVTSFHGLRAGDCVNLERSLRFGGKMGGHFVSGHVDGVGKVALFEERGADFLLRVEPAPEFMRYLVYKGSVAIDGISLTVAEVDSSGFSVWIIPHTRRVTNLRHRRTGDRVNLEFDLLAKYVERLTTGRTIERSPGS